MHGYLTRPSVECARDVYLTTAMFPSEDGGDCIIVRGGEGCECELKILLFGRCGRGGIFMVGISGIRTAVVAIFDVGHGCV